MARPGRDGDAISVPGEGVGPREEDSTERQKLRESPTAPGGAHGTTVPK